MNIKHIKFADYKKMLWKNGKGYTYEIAKDYNEVYQWRISQAEIKENGLFSNFPAYQRIISVIDGEGIVLQVSDDNPVSLKALDSFAFDGASDTHCTLIDGSVQDFNLIYMPNLYSANFQWQSINADKQDSIISSASIILIYALDSDLALFINQETISINKQDSIILCLSDLDIVNINISSKSQAKYCILQLFKK